MPSDKGFLNKAYEAGKGFLKKVFWRGDGVGEKSMLSPLSIDEMAQKCLLVYLEPYEKILLQSPENITFEMLLREVRDVFHQHKEPMVQNAKVPIQSVTKVSALFFSVETFPSWFCLPFTPVPFSIHSVSVQSVSVPFRSRDTITTKSQNRAYFAGIRVAKQDVVVVKERIKGNTASTQLLDVLQSHKNPCLLRAPEDNPRHAAKRWKRTQWNGIKPTVFLNGTRETCDGDV